MFLLLLIWWFQGPIFTSIMNITAENLTPNWSKLSRQSWNSDPIWGIEQLWSQWKEMIGVGDDVGGGIKSREDQMTQSEQSGLSNLCNLVCQRKHPTHRTTRGRPQPKKFHLCQSWDDPSQLGGRKTTFFLKFPFSFHIGFGTACYTWQPEKQVWV